MSAPGEVRYAPREKGTIALGEALRILVLHNHYQYAGGEDVQMQAEVQLLRDAGHEVHVEVVNNSAIVGQRAKIRTFFSAPYDGERYSWAADLIANYRPDVVHIHNFFPLLTPAIHHSARHAGVAVVQTLQNYRLFCANAFFLREGAICEKCLHGTRYWGVFHKCYRDSFAGSLAVVRMQNRAFARHTWDEVDQFIALTEFGREKFASGGLPSDRISVKPNTLSPEWQAPTPVRADRAGALFVGRLSREKGVDTLLKAWAKLPDIPLTIIGDGPEAAQLRSLAPPNASFLGALNRDLVRKHMQQALCLVMPSRWYEGLPLTAIEAFSLSLPVICSRIGSLAEIVEHGRNGWHFEVNDVAGLADIARSVFGDPRALAAAGQQARGAFDAHYSGQRNLQMLTDIYRRAIRYARSRGVTAAT